MIPLCPPSPFVHPTPSTNLLEADADLMEDLDDMLHEKDEEVDKVAVAAAAAAVEDDVQSFRGNVG
jgi:hypothetical protein